MKEFFRRIPREVWLMALYMVLMFCVILTLMWSVDPAEVQREQSHITIEP